MTGAGELAGALRPVIEALDRSGIPYMVAGSVASSIHGVPRTTLDTDLVASVEERHERLLVETLGKDYYADEAQIRDAVRRSSSFNIIHQRTMLKIDVFLPKGRPYDEQALARRKQETIAGISVFAATPEDVLLSKLEWYERGGRVSDRQWSDVLGILKVQRGALDPTYLRHWAGELGVADSLERALNEAR